MKALTVRQPWAWSIMLGGKDVENRSQVWAYRGPLLIHAAREWSDFGATDPNAIAASKAAGRTLAATRSGAERCDPYEYEFGVILGSVNLVDVHHATYPGAASPCCSSPWAQFPSVGPATHLILEDPRPLVSPFPIAGALGLWEFPTALIPDLWAPFPDLAELQR